MKRGKKLIINIDKDGNTQVEAYCLATDSWHDFEYFINAAEVSKTEGKERDSNRELRAALLCLFSHLEGVVHQLMLEINDFLPDENMPHTLCDKTKVISRIARQQTKVPDLGFRLGKYLRDIIVHPGAEKFFGGKSLGESEVFEKLNTQTIRAISERIDAWLNCVCSIFEVSRFTDTESMVKEFSEKLGKSQGIREV